MMLKVFKNLIKPGRVPIHQPINQRQHLRLFATETAAATESPSSSNKIEIPQASQTYVPDNLYKRLEIEIKGCDPAVLKSYEWFATTAANNLGIQIGKCWAERKSRKHRFTLLKCVHIQKKHRVQYELRTYYRFLEFQKLTGSTLSTFLEYIERNLPEGVALKATKIEIQSIPEHLQKPPGSV